MENVAEAVWLFESVTWTVKLAMPVADGVPVMTPVGETARLSVARLLGPVRPEVTVHV
jgi:hypothetical protein